MTGNPASCYAPGQRRRSTLIDSASVIMTPNGAMRNASLLIEANGSISGIGSKENIMKEASDKPEIVLDGKKRLLMPGYINNHSHIAMTLLRGLAEDLPLLNWLRDKIWPLEATLKPWQIEVGAIVGCVECLLTGTTTVNSNYFFDPAGSEASAAFNTGIRAVLSHGIFDWTAEKALRLTEEFVQTWHGKDSGRIRISTGAHSPYSCSPSLLREIEERRNSLNEKYGKEYRIIATIHVAEATTEAQEIQQKYGQDARSGIAAYLHRLGVLTSDTVAAHAIHLLDDDYAAFKETGASIASCPVSNLKVGMGVADLPRDLEEGITLSLGTDGPASNNTLDMFETTKFASLLQKGLRGDTTVLGSKVAFDLGTAGGAHSLKLSETGSIEKGKRADIVLLNLDTISSTPFHDPYNHVAFAARSGDVRDVFVDGRHLVQSGEITSIRMERLNAVVEEAVDELRHASPSLVP